MRYKFIKTAKWRVRRHLRVAVAMCAFATLQCATAASYSFTNAEGGDATVAANWQGGAIPSAVDTTASVAFTNVGSSATAVLSDGYYAWKDLIFGQGSFSVAACDENGRPRSYTVCRVDSISGIDERRDFSDGLGRRWKVLEGGDGKTLKLEYVPGTTLIVF